MLVKEMYILEWKRDIDVFLKFRISFLKSLCRATNDTTLRHRFAANDTEYCCARTLISPNGNRNDIIQAWVRILFTRFRHFISFLVIGTSDTVIRVTTVLLIKGAVLFK